MIDRFNRQNFHIGKSVGYNIQYTQKFTILKMFNRDILPCCFYNTGQIMWASIIDNDKEAWLHNDQYPALTNITGIIEYWNSGHKVSRFEAVI